MRSLSKTREGLSISFPKSFSKSKDSTAIYNLKRINSKVNGKNLFNLVYKNKNGNKSKEDKDGADEEAGFRDTLDDTVYRKMYPNFMLERTKKSKIGPLKIQAMPIKYS